jgi:hypothetical protein
LNRRLVHDRQEPGRHSGSRGRASRGGGRDERLDHASRLGVHDALRGGHERRRLLDEISCEGRLAGRRRHVGRGVERSDWIVRKNRFRSGRFVGRRRPRHDRDLRLVGRGHEAQGRKRGTALSRSRLALAHHARQLGIDEDELWSDL